MNTKLTQQSVFFFFFCRFFVQVELLKSRSEQCAFGCLIVPPAERGDPIAGHRANGGHLGHGA